MFTLDYKIIRHDYEGIPGAAGFFRITCGPLEYGEYWPSEIERHMATYWLMPWFRDFAEMLLSLKKERYIALIDIENYRGWLEFTYADDKVYLNIADANADVKPSFILKGENERLSQDTPRRFPDNIFCSYQQFRDVIVQKTTQYLTEVIALNQGTFSASAPHCEEAASFRANVERLQQALAEFAAMD